MATSVTVLCSNARRISIKVTPNTSILQILEQVCSKQGVNHPDFELVHQRKVLDLSLSVRFANLPNNALLELRPSQTSRKESKVVVCMQTEGGGRLIHDFTPDLTLWDIFTHWIQEKGLNFLSGDADQDAEPVCLYMRKEVVGETNLKETSLRSLGLTGGNAVIRLFFRHPETLKSQAYVEALQMKPKDEVSPVNELIVNRVPEPEIPANVDSKVPSEPTSHGNVASLHEISQDIDMVDEIKETTDEHIKENPPEAVVVQTSSVQPIDNHRNITVGEAMHLNEENMEEDKLEENDEIIYVGDNHAILYDAKHITSHVTENLPEDFFELTVEDARYLYATLQQQRKDLENQTLCLHSHKEAKRLERLFRFKNSILRLQFPDQLVLQAKFSTLAKVSSVMEFIRPFLADERIDFYLFTTPPKTELNPEQALYEAGLVPASLVHLASKNSDVLKLKPEFFSKISSHRAACEAAKIIRNSSRSTYKTEIVVPMQSQELAHPSHKENKFHMQQEQQGNADVTASTESTSSKFVPKWFKGPK